MRVRVFGKLCLVLLCLGIAATAKADLNTGTWESTALDSDIWTGPFDPGEWAEDFWGGGPGQVDNQLTSFGYDYYLDALLETVTPLDTVGGLDGYETIYGSVIFELENFGPWGSDPVDSFFDVTMEEVIVTSWKNDNQLKWSLTGTGSLTYYPAYDVLIEATFDSTQDSYTPATWTDGTWHEGDVGWAQISIVPVPGAALLGSLGLGVAGSLMGRFNRRRTRK